MPILPPEPPISDPAILDAPVAYGEGDRRGWLLHAKPRTEKSLARKIRGRCDYFLPVQRFERARGNKTVTSTVPLFPGYLFLFGDHEDRLLALQTNLLVAHYPVEQQERLRADLRGVYRLMESRLPMFAEETLTTGDPVKVIRGPLTGLEGTVIRRGPRLNFVIEVHMLNRGVVAEVEAWMLSPAEKPVGVA